MNIIVRQLQVCLNEIEKWARENGFQLSGPKAVGACMHVYNKETSIQAQS